MHVVLYNLSPLSVVYFWRRNVFKNPELSVPACASGAGEQIALDA